MLSMEDRDQHKVEESLGGDLDSHSGEVQPRSTIHVVEVHQAKIASIGTRWRVGQSGAVISVGHASTSHVGPVEVE